MRDDSEKFEKFTRRAFILGGLKLSMMSILIGRLYYLQILKSDEFNIMSEKNRIKLSVIPSARGIIYDCNNLPLAINQNSYRLIFHKDEVDNLEDLLAKLAIILDLPEDEVDILIKKISSSTSNVPIVLTNNLSWTQVAKIEENAPDLRGISVDVGQIRAYPYDSLFAHVIGYVANIGENKKASNIFANTDIRVGKSGIEKTYEEELAGKNGTKRTEVDAKGNLIKELSNLQSVTGLDLTLTVNLKLQELLTSRLDIRGATGVIIDVNNGDILAMNSTPAFDPNQFAQGISLKYWNQLNEDPSFPLMNKAVSMQFPPGSTFKPVTALAALEAGLDPKQRYLCPGYYMIGDRKMHCWRKDHGHGYVDMEEAIAYSCNVYLFNIAKKIGGEKIAETARMLGFGHKLCKDIQSEQPGILPSKTWKLLRFKRDWQQGDTLNFCIGQGFMLSTILQLAVMSARIASGKEVYPNLLYNYVDEPKKLLFAEKNLEIIRNGMTRAVNVPGGTGYASRIMDPNIQMAGKTGTAQVVSKRGSAIDLSKASVPWENRNHGLFVGYAPVSAPKYAAAVLIEHGGSGAATAPIVRDILHEALKLSVSG